MTKHIFPTLIIATLLFLQTTNAKVWTVSNKTADKVDFTTVDAAQSSANSGDTLYVLGSGISYGDITITKKLTLIGPGYFLAENSNTQARLSSAKLGSVTISHTAQGAVLMSFEVTGTVIINANDVIIKRNYFYTVANNSTIIIANDANFVSNVIIIQNFIKSAGSSNIDIIYAITNQSANVVISNNFIQRNYSAYYSLHTGNNEGYVICNNIMNGQIYIFDGYVQNNIFRGEVFVYGSNNIVSNNVTDNGQVFVGTGSTDGQWQLKPGSPAIGAGVGGVDCGMFGGDSPYVLSGIPSIPTIYFFNAPLEGGNQLPVQIKIKSNK